MAILYSSFGGQKNHIIGLDVVAVFLFFFKKNAT